MTMRSLVTTVGALLLAVFGTPSLTYAQDWSEEAALPRALYSIAAVAAGGDIYVAGGTDGRGAVSDALLRYDVADGSWHDDLPAMDVERYFAAAVVLGDKIYVTGGREDDDEVLESVEVFDLRTREWSEAGELEEGRYGHTAVVLEGRIYVLGGADDDGDVLESVEVYDAEEDEWKISEEWSLDQPRAAFATVVVGQAAYSFGGISRVPLPHVQRFDFQIGSVVFIPPAILDARAYVAAVVVGDTSVFIIGGRNVRNRVLDDVVRFAPSGALGRQWELEARLRTARDSFAAVEIDGRVYVIGGRDAEERPIASMESWTAGANVGTEDPEAWDFDLEQNHPNPFTTSTRIAFAVGDAGEHVRLEIFDLQGRMVHRMIDGYLPAGRHEVEWDGTAQGRPSPSGVYLYLLRHGQSQRSKMMTRIR